ncbi:MAG: redox-regulated ATPase YchF [Deltaproteobacteria bacterium]|nr:redox-regulated ATPase YchF [Deltaproteobacteria bacterium]MBW2533757.1 redox-regulated ATPase YchF [Deltaproteobacteria bacterium]
MRIALLGLEQGGKRTLFELLTGRAVPEGRKPDEPVEGIARIRDARVDVLSELCHPDETTYAQNHFVLCPDLSGGNGRQHWLEIARRSDLLCPVVRAFESDEVYHPAGTVDPDRDRRELEAEFVLHDLAMVEQRLDRLTRELKSGHTPERDRELAALDKIKPVLEAEGDPGDAALDPQEQATLEQLGLLCLKPRLWCYNVSEDDVARDFGPGTFSVSARIEREIAELGDAAERAEYLASLGLEATGLDRLNAAAYDLLGLMSFYTIGSDEVRAWTVRKGATAPVAGAKIHTDIGRGFIRVEVIKYDDIVAAGSERAARDKGKVQVRGRDYVMEDGDVCHFLFNV